MATTHRRSAHQASWPFLAPVPPTARRTAGPSIQSADGHRKLPPPVSRDSRTPTRRRAILQNPPIYFSGHGLVYKALRRASVNNGWVFQTAIKKTPRGERFASVLIGASRISYSGGSARLRNQRSGSTPLRWIKEPNSCVNSPSLSVIAEHVLVVLVQKIGSAQKNLRSRSNCVGNTSACKPNRIQAGRLRLEKCQSSYRYEHRRMQPSHRKSAGSSIRRSQCRRCFSDAGSLRPARRHHWAEWRKDRHSSRSI